jgi:hypothetical protein
MSLRSRFRRWRPALILAARLAWICVMLFLISAMANRNISDFVYRGF